MIAHEGEGQARCYLCARETSPEVGWVLLALRYPCCWPCLERATRISAPAGGIEIRRHHEEAA